VGAKGKNYQSESFLHVPFGIEDRSGLRKKAELKGSRETFRLSNQN